MSRIILRGAMLVDGLGNPGYPGDLVVEGDRIAAILAPGAAEAAAGEDSQLVDVSGLVVAPGFIDMHAHSDLAVLADAEHLAKVQQGITLEVVGQDGLGYAPVTDDVMAVMREQIAGWNGNPEIDYSWRSVADYLDRVDLGAPLNVATLVPHGTVRMVVMGMENRPATESELQQIRELVADGLRDGALGMSVGLSYAPGMYASDAEIEHALGAVREWGGFYCPHHRNYGSEVVQGYVDCLEVAARAGVPLHLAHCHVNFPLNRGKAPEVLAAIDRAIECGGDITLDAYPYLSSATYLASMLPGWAQSGSVDETLALLADADGRSRVLHEIEVLGSDGQHGVPVDWATISISAVVQSENAWAVGHDIASLAADRGVAPGDLFADLLIADRLGPGCLMAVGNEENMIAVMGHRAHTIGTDGILVGEKPHPRGWGSFPAWIGEYARDRGVCSLEEAVLHVTSRPAGRLGLTERGVLAIGNFADLVVFDADLIGSPASYDEPTLSPTGIAHVIVNGEFAVRDGRRTTALAGRSVRRAPSC